ncbi:MAG TPA: phosphoglucomutase/phosphomannomutase family protein [Candidatus Binatia bacterium]|nr:phosphoglucomutase/phosphomannomutase family protein [Candidatus Binatia bacterium]
MAAPIVFGTDGWRAVIADDFTYDRVRAVAQAVAWYLEGDGRGAVVGHDTRFSAELFAEEVARVLAANGHRVLLLDRPAPTPAITWTVVEQKRAGGVVVTASHNPAEFNGLKYKPDYGGSAPPEVTAQLEKLTARALEEGVRAMPFEEALASGRVEKLDPTPEYLAQVGRLIDLARLTEAGLSILHEPMYGAGTGLIRAAIGGAKTQVTEMHAERNPGFGGLHPEPIGHYMPEAMARMRDGGFDLCIANDGDADRVGIIDETGRFITQLEVMSLLAMYLLEKRGERGHLIRSITCSVMIDSLGQRFGVPVIETPVGFKYIGPKMIETDALLGGEESGGFAFRGHIPERDGIVAGLMIAQMVVDYGMPLSRVLGHLFDLVGPHSYARHDVRFDRDAYAGRRREVEERMRGRRPQGLAGVAVTGVRDDDGFKFLLADSSWVLVRMSGTEPLMRVYAEAATPERVDELLRAMEEMVGISPPAARSGG